MKKQTNQTVNKEQRRLWLKIQREAGKRQWVKFRGKHGIVR
jgi:hypothetical protein